MRKNCVWLLLAAVGVVCSSCSHKVTSALNNVPEVQKSIVILYENDVHCGIDGYAKIAGLRDAINASDTAFATAVCIGDFLQGNTTGAISKGQYIIDIMKGVGYDAVTLGNHEFDYGVPRLEELMQQVNAPVICANLYEPSNPSPLFPAQFQETLADAEAVFTASEGRIRQFALDSLKLASPTVDKIRSDCRKALPKVAMERYGRAFDAFTEHFSHVGEDTSA